MTQDGAAGGHAPDDETGPAGAARAASGGAESFDLVVESAAPTDAVFALLADGGGWASWAGPLVPRSRWHRTGTPAPGGVGAVRELGRRPMIMREEIVEFSPPRRLAYTVVSGVPVRDYLGTVDLDPLPGGGTRITWRATFVPAYRGTGRLLCLALKPAIRSIARRLARAAAVQAASPTPAGAERPSSDG